MTIELIDGASENRRQAVLGALTLAFARDPMMRWLYPEPDVYLKHFPKFADAFGGPSFGAGTVWASDDTSAAALWFPSGVHPDGEMIESVVLETVDKAKHETIGATLEKWMNSIPRSLIGISRSSESIPHTRARGSVRS